MPNVVLMVQIIPKPPTATSAVAIPKALAASIADDAFICDKADIKDVFVSESVGLSSRFIFGDDAVAADDEDAELETGKVAVVWRDLRGGGADEVFRATRAAEFRCLRNKSRGMANAKLVPINCKIFVNCEYCV